MKKVWMILVAAALLLCAALPTAAREFSCGYLTVTVADETSEDALRIALVNEGIEWNAVKETLGELSDYRLTYRVEGTVASGMDLAFLIPPQFDAAKTAVIFIDVDGTAEVLPTRLDPQTGVLTARGVSGGYYSLVELTGNLPDEPNGETRTNFGALYLALTVIAVAAVAVAVAVIVRRKSGKTEC